MADGLHPTAADDLDALSDPQAVVEAFLAALAAKDVATAAALVDDEIDYVNVGLPTVHGRADMQRVFDLLARPGAGFEVYLHAISADGAVVLTERTDVLHLGPVVSQFWVWGRFEVVDGRITLWRDSFDFLDVARGTLRGIAALVLRSLRPVRPAHPGTPPGR